MYVPLEYEDVHVQAELDDGDSFAAFVILGVLEVEPHESIPAHLASEHTLILQQDFLNLLIVGGVDNADLPPTMDICERLARDAFSGGDGHGDLEGAKQRKGENIGETVTKTDRRGVEDE